MTRGADGRRRLLGLVVGVIVVGLVAVTAAGAYWTLRGSGSGDVGIETVASVTLTPGSATTELYPGMRGDVAVSIANANTFRAFVGSLVLDTSQGANGFSVTGGQPGCDPAALSYTVQSNGGAGWFVVAGATLDLDLASAVDLGTGAASGARSALRRLPPGGAVRRPVLPARSVRSLAVVVTGAVACALLAQVGLSAFGAAAAPAAPRISSAPLRPTISTRATVAFDRVPNLGYECSLDAAVYRSCPSPVTFRNLSRSLHTLRVRAVKPGGATSGNSSYSWTVVAPRTLSATGAHLRPVMTTAPVRPWISRNATFAWLLRRGTHGECRLDAARWKRCRNPTTYLGLALGQHVFRVRAKAVNGRRSSANRFTWTISETPPPPPPEIGSGPEGSTTSTDATFQFAVVDGAAAECRLDGGAWLPCSSPVVYVGLAIGSHVFCVRAVAADGTVGPQTCRTWTITAGATQEPSGAFAISGSLPSLLSPGGGGALPLTVSNPYDFPLRVTGLTVTVLAGSSQPGCDGPANLRVAQSSTAGGSVSIVVPAFGSVTLPAQGATAPVVSMLDLPTNQDACKNASFALSYRGTGTRA